MSYEVNDSEVVMPVDNWSVYDAMADTIQKKHTHTHTCSSLIQANKVPVET